MEEKLSEVPIKKIREEKLKKSIYKKETLRVEEASRNEPNFKKLENIISKSIED